jgi:hypothetical protein
MRLYDLMGFDKVAKLFERQTIEIAPLAYMRGRTLNHSFIILDEAQNTTPEQMKMFLTRIGFGTRAVITGDVTQIDLARGSKSGLIEAERVLRTCAASRSAASRAPTSCAIRWCRRSSMRTSATRRPDARAARRGAPRLALDVQYAVPRKGLPAPATLKRWAGRRSSATSSRRCASPGSPRRAR